MEKCRNMSKGKKASFIIGSIFLGIGAVILFTFVTMSLWNWLMPAIFSLGVITFWQAGGIFILGRILFGGFGNGHGHNMQDNRKKKFWYDQYKEKWQNIPKEKHEEYINKMEEKGYDGNND